MLAVSAWMALAEGARDKAIALMRSAADGEDGSLKHVAMENRLYPMRELLAELLLEAGQPARGVRGVLKALAQTRTATAVSTAPRAPRRPQAIVRTRPTTTRKLLAAGEAGDGSRPEASGGPRPT